MRTKTEAKRLAILDAAAKVFVERGFDRASMTEIAARVGGSKSTIYNYFSSKEEIFGEVLYASVAERGEEALAALDAGDKDVALVLEKFGEQFLALIYSPDVMAGRRMILAYVGRSDIGTILYARGRGRVEKTVADFLRSAMDKGKLRPADPVVATSHLLGLLESELIEPFYYGVRQSVSAAEIEAVTSRAVAAFLAAYV